MSPDDQKIRLGVVGASIDLGGWAALAHLPAIAASPDVVLTGVCTTRQESADRAAAAYGAPLAFHDYRTMIEHPEIDAIAVVVRVPSHFDPTKAAIEAGKPVYTEWPLGRTTAEAIELTDLAAARGVPTAVGLQARVNPGFAYMRDLIADGFVGEVLTCRASLIHDGAIDRPSSRTWQRDASLGANTLTIGGGHTLDALISLVGSFSTVTGVVSAEVTQWFETDSGRLVDVTAPDNLLMSGRLSGGGVASLHVSDTPGGKSGLEIEVYGREGALIATGDRAPQYVEVHLRGARGSDALAEMPIPEKYVYVPPAMPKGVPFTVGQMYHQFARTIRDGSGAHPDFATAVALHRVIDGIAAAVRERTDHDAHGPLIGVVRGAVATDPASVRAPTSRTIGANRTTGTDDLVTLIYLNGEERELDGAPTVADVARLFPVTRGVAVARNGEVVPRSAWEITAIEARDRFEVLSVAPGG